MKEAHYDREFIPNKAPVEIVKKGVFGRIYFRDIYSKIAKKYYKNSWKEFDELKNIDQKQYSSNYCDVNWNNYKIKTRISLRFWENN